MYYVHSNIGDLALATENILVLQAKAEGFPVNTYKGGGGGGGGGRKVEGGGGGRRGGGGRGGGGGGRGFLWILTGRMLPRRRSWWREPNTWIEAQRTMKWCIRLYCVIRDVVNRCTSLTLTWSHVAQKAVEQSLPHIAGCCHSLHSNYFRSWKKTKRGFDLEFLYTEPGPVSTKKSEWHQSNDEIPHTWPKTSSE